MIEKCFIIKNIHFLNNNGVQCSDLLAEIIILSVLKLHIIVISSHEKCLQMILLQYTAVIHAEIWGLCWSSHFLAWRVSTDNMWGEWNKLSDSDQAQIMLSLMFRDSESAQQIIVLALFHTSCKSIKNFKNVYLYNDFYLLGIELGV